MKALQIFVEVPEHSADHARRNRPELSGRALAASALFIEDWPECTYRREQ